MKNRILSRGQLPAVASIGLTFICYVAEKVFKRLTPWNEASAIIQAIIFTCAVFVVLALLYKSKDIFYGLMASIFAFKMLPPDILMLRSTNIDAAAVYYLVRKAALVLFLLMIYKFYKMQETQDKYEKIHAASIGALLLVVPFCSEIGAEFANYALMRTGSMMLPYALQAAAYIVAVCVLAGVCFLFKGKSAVLIADFSIIGFFINAARKAVSVLIIASAGYHVSKSYICWIIIYAVMAVVMVLVRKKTKNARPAELAENR
ncbi:MAG: hypothetical protein ACI4IH_07335 [Eubacterium sp.]